MEILFTFILEQHPVLRLTELLTAILLLNHIIKQRSNK